MAWQDLSRVGQLRKKLIQFLTFTVIFFNRREPYCLLAN